MINIKVGLAALAMSALAAWEVVGSDLVNVFPEVFQNCSSTFIRT